MYTETKAQRLHYSGSYVANSAGLENPREFRRIAKATVRALKGVEYDAIAFRGMSGAVMAPLIAALTGRYLFAVRKPEESYSSHSSRIVEGPSGECRYIIVDDFVSSGTTIHEILGSIHDFNKHALCVGIVEYDRLGSRSDVFDKTPYKFGSAYCDLYDSLYPEGVPLLRDNRVTKVTESSHD